MKTFKQHIEAFDRDEFRRHMSTLKAKEELKKTNPVAAKASELADKAKEQMTGKKKSEPSSARSWWQDHPHHNQV